MLFPAIATLLLVPPVNLIFVGAAGLIFWRRRAGPVLIAVALAGLFLLALPFVSEGLIAGLESGLAGPAAAAPAAIIILGAEVSVSGDEPPQVEPGRLTLERLRAGAALARRTQLPILVSGGVVREGVEPVADVMARSLRQDFGVPVRWLETRSRDTWENARLSAAILEPLGIRSVAVVSHAWHLRRALIAMRHFGLEATPAPVQLDPWPSWRLGAFMPRASALLMSYYAWHEWIGCAYYALRR